MKQLIITLFVIINTASIIAQTDKDKAYDLGMKAITEMENGNISESIKLLEKCKKLDPTNMNYPYEIAFANYLDKDYKSAIKILKKLTKHEDANDRVWQMLGNSYDLNKEPEKAIKSYDEGIENFPNSGKLYLERANMEAYKENFQGAIDFYEKGIQVEPMFPSNYFNAATIFLNSKNKVWGMIYGEIFMNLERNSKRTATMSSILYESYKNNITYISDTSMTVNFCEEIMMNVNEMSDPSKFKMPFSMVYEPTLLMSIAFTDSIDINSLDEIRSDFIENYFSLGHDKNYPNLLFDYQKQVQANGHMESYNHWILMKGDEEAFGNWLELNDDKWKKFVEWFSKNSIKIDQSNLFYHSQY
jgi:tetratricopeptide (TPR) repeat protein